MAILWSALVRVFWTILFTGIVTALVSFLQESLGYRHHREPSFEWALAVLGLGALLTLAFVFHAGMQTARVIPFGRRRPV